jgi:hypothetical protein
MKRHWTRSTVFFFLLFSIGGESFLFAQQKTNSYSNRQSDYDEDEFSELYNERWLGISFATGLDRSKVVYGLHQYFLTLGEFVTPDTWVQLNASYLHTPIHQTINPEYNIKDGVSILELGAEVRTYSPSFYSFFGHYFFAGAGLAHAYWDYGGNNSEFDLPAASGASVWGIDVHLGTGFFLGQTIPITTNLDIIPGVTFWFMGTYQGHYYTVMPALYYLKIRLSLWYAVTTL